MFNNSEGERSNPNEDELLEYKEKYRGLSEAAFESIFISEKGLCLDQNKTAEKMLLEILIVHVENRDVTLETIIKKSIL